MVIKFDSSFYKTLRELLTKHCINILILCIGVNLVLPETEKQVADLIKHGKYAFGLKYQVGLQEFLLSWNYYKNDNEKQNKQLGNSENFIPCTTLSARIVKLRNKNNYSISIKKDESEWSMIASNEPSMQKNNYSCKNLVSYVHMKNSKTLVFVSNQKTEIVLYEYQKKFNSPPPNLYILTMGEYYRNLFYIGFGFSFFLFLIVLVFSTVKLGKLKKRNDSKKKEIWFSDLKL